MKRKIALLMAGVMALSMVPTMGVFAGSSNRLSVPINADEKQVLVESTINISNTGAYPTPGGSAYHKDIKNGVIKGTDLVIKLSDPIAPDSVIKLQLENAKWFFRNGTASDQWDGDKGETFDNTFNSWDPVNGTKQTTGTYTRVVQGGVKGDIPYELTVSASDESIATLKVLPKTGMTSPPTNPVVAASTAWAKASALANALGKTGAGIADTAASAKAWANPATGGTPEGPFNGAVVVAIAAATGGTSPDNQSTTWAGDQYAEATAAAAALNRFAVTLDKINEDSNTVTTGHSALLTATNPFTGVTMPTALATLRDVSEALLRDADTLHSMAADITAGTDDVKVAIDAYGRVRAELVSKGVTNKLGAANDDYNTAFPTPLNTLRTAVTTLVDTSDTGTDDLASELRDALGALDGAMTGSEYGKDLEIVIPLVVRTTSAEGVRIKITDSNAKISKGTYLISDTSTSATKTTAKTITSARDEFELDHIVISETRMGSLKPGGAFRLTLPHGYAFNNPAQGYKTAPPPSVGYEESLAGTGASIAFDKSGGEDVLNTLVVRTGTTKLSDKVPGAVFIRNLVFYTTEENLPFGDIKMEIKDIKSNEGTQSKVTNEKFVVATRSDWTVKLSVDPDSLTDGKLPELYAGRYDGVADPWRRADSISDDEHLAATVVFEELSPAAWASLKTTEFKLPEGVKFRKVEIKDVEKMTGERLTTQGFSDHPGTGSNPGSQYVPDGKKHGDIILDSNVLKMSALTVDTGEKAQIVMKVWLSISADFPDGEIKMTASGSAIPGETAPSVAIAKAVAPIKVKTKTTQLKIGLQYQETANIEIIESKAGALQKDKEVRVSMADGSTLDMGFATGAKVAVTSPPAIDGPLKIKDIIVTNDKSGTTTGTGTGITSLNIGSGEIHFVVAAESSKASTITLSNLSVAVNRSVPNTNKSAYKAIVWGGAVAPNYRYYDFEPSDVGTAGQAGSVGKSTDKDRFNVPGYMADYLAVTTPADQNVGSASTAKVELPIGEKYFVLNGKTIEMDVAAFVQDGNTMVPLRFVAQALGIPSTDITYDDKNRTVTIMTAGRIVQFKDGDSAMMVNGASVPMVNEVNAPVKMFIDNEAGRSFVPFRQLGKALGIEVSWDDEKQTAIYNPNAPVAVDTADAEEEETEEAEATATPAPSPTPAA